MRDPDPNIRDACLDELKRFGTRQAVWRFQALLKSADNKQVNRAGACLAVLKDPEATQSLIDALVTEHKYLYQTGGSPGQMNLGSAVAVLVAAGPSE
jgi:HEAT repeat protein